MQAFKIIPLAYLVVEYK